MITVYDPSVSPFRIEFIDGRARALYLRTVNRLRRKWLDEHGDMWRPYAPTEDETAVSQRIEGNGCGTLVAPATNTPAAAHNEVSSLTRPDRSLDARQVVHVAPPVVAAVASSRDEIIIGGQRLISQRCVVAKLGINKRTLLRWHTRKIGPPRVKIGRGVFYDQDKLMDWLQRHG
jgi:predicted DNA-binding transcriptional regulator AlpA